MSRTGCVGDAKLMNAMHRSIATGTAFGAHLFAAFLNDTQQIVSTALFFGPGVEVCGEWV